MTYKPKIIRTSTVPTSLKTFLSGSFEVLMAKYELVLVSSPGQELDELHKEYGMKTIGVSMERRMSPMKDLRSLWGMIRVFRKERPYMVHSMTPKAGLLCMLAAWITRVPRRVHTFTGLVWPTSTGLSRRILMTTDRLTCACATHIIPEGEGVKADLLNNHITRKPIRVLGYGNVMGVDMEKFNPNDAQVLTKTKELRTPGVFTFVFVGRIVGDKGINELVEAFVRLNQEYSDIRLLLVGRYESELDPLRAETVSEINRSPAIEAVGNQSDVRPWLAASDALVFPSYREGFPNVVLEAGAMGLPSIVTDINGSREIIIEGQNGVIIPSHNVDALYNAMRDFITNPEKVSKLAANARELIASRFEQGFVQRCLLEYYKEILGV